MHQRPIGDLVDALRQLGAEINYLGSDGFPPLEIKPAHIHAGRVTLRGNISSQFLTGLLLALPLSEIVAGERVTIEVMGSSFHAPMLN